MNNTHFCNMILIIPDIQVVIIPPSMQVSEWDRVRRGHGPAVRDRQALEQALPNRGLPSISYLTESVYKAVLQKSTPPQLRNLLSTITN